MKKYILFIVLLIFSSNACNADYKKDSVNMGPRPLKMTFYILSLQGKMKIYEIEKDSISYFSEEKKKLSDEDATKLYSIPETLENKDEKYGCGVCVDGVDFIIEFHWEGDRLTKLEFTPADVEGNVSDFVKIYLEKYDSILIK